jgi:hypothetical protein
MNSTTTNTKTTKKPRRMAREPKPVAPHGVGETPGEDANSTLPAPSLKQAVQPHSALNPEKPASKASVVLKMLKQPGGATLAQMVAATGWLPHTTRAVLTGFKKKGHFIARDKVEGVRTYRVARAAAEPTPTAADAQHTADV